LPVSINISFGQQQIEGRLASAEHLPCISPKLGHVNSHLDSLEALHSRLTAIKVVYSEIYSIVRPGNPLFLSNILLLPRSFNAQRLQLARLSLAHLP
jgi:hypothetical protein